MGNEFDKNNIQRVMKMGKVIAMTNNKGGVGKSSSAVNLGYALTQLKKTVLLLDLDSQGSLTTYYGLDPEDLEYTMYDVIVGNCLPNEAIVQLQDDISIIPSSVDLSVAELELISKQNENMELEFKACLENIVNAKLSPRDALSRLNSGSSLVPETSTPIPEDIQFILKNRLKDIAGEYDFIIIDCGPSFGLLNFNALIASDYVIAPCLPEFLALKGLELMMGTIEQAQTINQKLSLMGVLITMCNNLTSHHSIVSSEIRKRYQTFDSVIKRSTKFPDSSINGQSILQAAPKFDGAQAYLELAKEVIEYAK